MSAVTVPEIVTLLGAVSAVANLTVILVLVAAPLSSAIVPAIVIADVFSIAKTELSFKVIVELIVTLFLTVAVFEAAIVKLSAVTALVNVALLFKIISANEVVPTAPVIDAVPLPKVKVRFRLDPIASLSIVLSKLTLLLVVVRVTSAPKVTAPP